jgi:hypothetical protein
LVNVKDAPDATLKLAILPLMENGGVILDKAQVLTSVPYKIISLHLVLLSGCTITKYLARLTVLPKLSVLNHKLSSRS